MRRTLRGLMVSKVAVFLFLCLSVVAQSAKGEINFETSTISGFYGPFHIITADFNNDTYPDLAVTNWPGNQLTILLGDGLGNFSVASTLATGVHPNFIAAGDFDNSGSIDLAITNASGLREVSLFFNDDGTGTSWTSSTFLTDGEADLTSVVAANFTPSTDSNIDLFITMDSGYVEIPDHYDVWKGNGLGAFTEIANANTGSLPIFVAAGDFDGDGTLDLAIANYSSHSVTIVLGNGDGTFAEATGSPITVGTNPRGIATGHLNGDAHIDLAVVNPGNNTVSILLGNGDGTFAAAANVTSSGVPGSLVISDFDGDGKNDIAVTRSNANVVSIYRGNGDGTFDPTSIDFSVGTLPSFIAAGDLDKDGKPDLAVTNYNSNDVTILLNRSDDSPDPFSFTDQTDVLLNTLITSGAITVTGINVAASISVTNGEYEINESGTWTSEDGTVNNGDTVRVRQTSSTSYNTTTDSTLTIGGVSDVFSVTTLDLIGLVVTSANGGESWQSGTTQTIRWDYAGNPGTYVKIELLKGGVLNKVISSFARTSSRFFNWKVPATLTPGADYAFRITSKRNPAYTDTSDSTFTVLGPSLTLTSPNGGENWVPGTTQTIRWTYTEGPSAYLKIELLKGGLLNRTIANFALTNRGSFSWRIPATQVRGADYSIRITSRRNPSCTDVSNGDFAIGELTFGGLTF